MDVLRIFAAALAAAVGALAGYRKSRELKDRAVFLTEISSLLERFHIGIKNFKLTSDELLENENGAFARLVKSYRNEQTDIREAWEKACAELQNNLPAKREETALLSELGRSLGASDTESTLRLLEQCSERISQLRASAEAEFEKRGRAVFQIGALCGVGAAVLII